jgi:hypothetical protein
VLTAVAGFQPIVSGFKARAVQFPVTVCHGREVLKKRQDHKAVAIHDLLSFVFS